VDRAGIYGGPKRCNFSQVQRALEELGIHIIYANSPEGKGRIERLWDTLQDRLIPEMRIRKIMSYKSANEYLQNYFLPCDYAKFKVVPENLLTAYKPLPAGLDLKEIFCLKEQRTVNRDHTYSWNGATYRIDSSLKHSIYKQKIEIRTYQDITWKVFFAGNLIEVSLVNPEEKSIPVELSEAVDESKVRLDGHVMYLSKYYSVKEEFIGERVTVKEKEGNIFIYHESVLIESHRKIADQNQKSSTKPEHLGPWKRCLEPYSFYRESARRLGEEVEKIIVKIIEEGNGYINTGAIFGVLSFEKIYSAATLDKVCGQAMQLNLPDYRSVKTLLSFQPTRHQEKQKQQETQHRKKSKTT
jgi:hypothetical protein